MATATKRKKSAVKPSRPRGAGGRDLTAAEQILLTRAIDNGDLKIARREVPPGSYQGTMTVELAGGVVIAPDYEATFCNAADLWPLLFAGYGAMSEAELEKELAKARALADSSNREFEDFRDRLTQIIKKDKEPTRCNGRITGVVKARVIKGGVKALETADARR